MFENITIWTFVLMTCLYVTYAVPDNKPGKCLSDRPDVVPKIYPNYMGQHFNLAVVTSKRKLNLVNTEIFKIFLEEVMGFYKIDVIETDDHFKLGPVLQYINTEENEDEFVPKAQVSLEVWLPADYDETSLEDIHLVKEFGIVSPPGRFGWFIPWELRHPVEKHYKYLIDDVRGIHWTFLRDKKLVSSFDIDGDEANILHKYLEESKLWRDINCSGDENCFSGKHIPSQCLRDSCATLLAADYLSTKFVVNHIRELKLFVKVYWLGDKLKETVKDLTKIYRTNPNKSLLILHYTPSDLILRERNFINVAFKQCEILNSTRSIGCKYEINRIYKLAWNQIDSLGIGQLMRNYKFSEDDYDYLLTLYEKMSGREPRDIACQWLKDRHDTWSWWIKVSAKTNIYIGGIFPITNSSYNGEGILSGAIIARDSVNNNTSILPNHQLELLLSNGRCSPDAVMKSFIEYIVNGYYNKLVGVLGPACSDTVEPLAGVSKHYHIMIISYSAEGASFSDRDKYPYFFRTIGENKQYKHVYVALFKKLGWTRVAALTEDGQKYTEYISHMQEMLEENGINFISNTKFPRERHSVQMTRYLDDLKRKSARIIILDVYDEIARTVMCEAYKLKMTPADGYVWFLPNWLNETWYDTDYFKQKESVNCSTAEMIRAVTGYFSLAHAYYAPDDTPVIGNMTVAEWKGKYAERMKGKPVKKSNYAGYAYDAVWTYILALDTLIKSDPEAASDLHSENTTNKLVELIKATDFMGVSGRIKFRGGPSRFSVINIMEWYNKSLHTVGYFNPNLTDNKPEILGGELILNQKLLKWFTPDGKIPNDGAIPPEVCTLESVARMFNVNCQMALAILNIVIGSVVVLLLVAALYVIKRQYDKKVLYTQKYMRHLGIDLILNPADITDVDKWEIPRSDVVINRKLGEGAFGTVYGGEANLPDKGWVAVAVKTLKKGSTAEEKLDFLSEAEAMKRFDHKNIVRLLGVCTKEEPVYTIMEFMLYGDLKTFLLARRNLVDSKSIEDSDEISSKRLTAMALDVARGLSYLAEIKYVHRDLASRNCLVNERKVVKLGDFGMTRPMFENDYYRFSRRGMLPVRWMAPESLAQGVFTPASDVWSFGVLLYEIITFGNFPYQAMNNLQVLEYVKAGNTITIPKGVQTKLKILLTNCWHQDPKQRPRASEITEFLASNPRLIVPCLEVPMAAVEREEHENAEIDVPSDSRKYSSPNMKTSPSVPNGIVSLNMQRDRENLRHECASGSGVSIPLDSYCIKEPLLHKEKSTSSLINLGRYVSINKKDESSHEDTQLVNKSNENNIGNNVNSYSNL